MTVPQFLIYGLIDPRTGEIRYIGKSSTGMKRPNLHRKPSHLAKDSTYKARWIRELQREGLIYEIEVLEYLPNGDGLNTAERYWIREARGHGLRLTNSTDGGDGLSGAVFSEKHRARISAANKGRKLTEEQRKKISAAAKSRPYDVKRIEALRRSNLGRKRSRAFKSMIGRVHRGKVQSQETRSRIAAANGKPVVDLVTGQIYPSATAASRFLGIEVSGIIKVASGSTRLRSTHGHRFEYITA